MPPKLERPKQVNLVLAMLAVAALLSLAARILRFRQASDPLPNFAYGIAVAEILGAALILYALYAGHQWARIVTIVFSVLAIPNAVLLLFAGGTSETIVSALLSLAFSGVLCALLLSPSVRDWYRVVDR